MKGIPYEQTQRCENRSGSTYSCTPSSPDGAKSLPSQSAQRAQNVTAGNCRSVHVHIWPFVHTVAFQCGTDRHTHARSYIRTKPARTYGIRNVQAQLKSTVFANLAFWRERPSRRAGRIASVKYFTTSGSSVICALMGCLLSQNHAKTSRPRNTKSTMG